MDRAEVKSFASPDEVRTFDRGRLELLKVGERTVGRTTLEPGWRWSRSVQPIAQTKSCQASHFQYQVSGRLKVVMDDGMELDLKAGDLSVLPAGHDAWVVGNEAVVLIDFQGMAAYAQEPAKMIFR